MTRQFKIWFTNITGCAMGISDISLFVEVSASSESDAMDSAMERARELNHLSGLPPHGIHVNEVELRRLAVIVPETISN